MVVTLKPFDERIGAGGEREGAHHEPGPEIHRHFRRHGGGAGAAADHRPRHRRRLHLCRQGHEGRRSQGAGAGRARPARRRQPGSEAEPGVQTFSATNPSIYLDIDRDKAQILGVPLNSIFQSLQASLGGYFVNNMNLFGRTWQVQVQAEADDRTSVDDIYRINVRIQRRQDDPAAQPRGSEGRGRPAGPDPLQQPRRGDGAGRPGRGRLVRPGAGGDGGGRGEDAARRLCRRMDRHRLPGEARRGQDGDHPRLRHPVRLSVPRRPLRKLDHPGAGPALGRDRRVRLLRCSSCSKG